MKIKPNIAVSDSGFVFNPDTGESYTVNPIGVDIINFLKESDSIIEISNHIRLKYNVDQPTFEKDFDDFMGLMRNYSLIIND